MHRGEVINIGLGILHHAVNQKQTTRQRGRDGERERYDWAGREREMTDRRSWFVRILTQSTDVSTSAPRWASFKANHLRESFARPNIKTRTKNDTPESKLSIRTMFDFTLENKFQTERFF